MSEISKLILMHQNELVGFLFYSETDEGKTKVIQLKRANLMVGLQLSFDTRNYSLYLQSNTEVMYPGEMDVLIPKYLAEKVKKFVDTPEFFDSCNLADFKLPSARFVIVDRKYANIKLARKDAIELT